MNVSRSAASRARRSYLFVPGNRPDRYAKACATRAHAVIVDLEDAVAPGDKVDARASLAAWLSPDHPVLVRVNAAGSEWFDADLRACTREGVMGVVLPKAERAEDIAQIVDVCGPGVAILPLVETARGLWNALEVARSPGVAALLFGSLDYQADLGTADDDLLHARSQLVLASRVAGIAAPVDGVTQSIHDRQLLRRDCLRSRELGFAGKVCIHPNQVDVVNASFAPSGEEIAWARAVVAAFAGVAGNAVSLNGRMIDRPVLLKARKILAESGAGELADD